MEFARASARMRVTSICFMAGIAALIFGGSLGAAPRQTTPPGDKTASDLLTPPEEKPIRGMNRPALSPDGKTLSFSYLGDIWTVPVSGGSATRLTVHESLDTTPRWSPDGKWIAFNSLRNGNTDIFLMPAEGGEVRQVTYYAGADVLADWSPDGNKLLMYSSRDTRGFAMYTIDLHNRAVKRLTNDDESLSYGSWSPDGRMIAYTRGGMPWWRPWYRGSNAASVVLEEVASGKVKPLLKSSTQQFWPFFAPDGRSVYITTIQGSSNTPNIWRVPLAGGAPKQITHYTTDAVRYPTMARNGSLITYLYNGDIYTVKPDGSDARKVSIIARSDDKVNNQVHEVLHSANGSDLSPDGKQLALIVRGNLWLVPTTGGDATRLTEGPADHEDIDWSPDGTKLVMVSDQGNQVDLYTVDVKTKAVTRLTNDTASESDTHFSPDGKWISYAKSGANPGLYIIPATGGEERRLAEGNGNNSHGTGINSHAWSPDSKWIAFSRMDRYENRDIWVVPVVGGAAINVTRYPGTNEEPQFTRDGRHLLFLSDRNGVAQLFDLPLEAPDDSGDDGAKKPQVDRSKDVKIDFDDIHMRAKALVAGVDDYAPTPDSQRIVIHGPLGFALLPMNGGNPQVIAPGEAGGHIQFVPNAPRFFYFGAGGTPRSLSAVGGPPAVVSFNADLIFDRRVQYAQAFAQFYREFGAGFYDPKMHGVDWKGLRAKYEPLLQSVGTPEEFASLLSEMVGEVNSSHSEISPASTPGGPQPSTLGIFYDNDYTGPGLKVTGVMRKGPADKPSTRVNPGDYIVSVDGKDVMLNEDYYRLLSDKAGKTVELLVNNKPSKEGARTFKLKPISLGAWAGLEYEARVHRNQELVDKLSGGRLAYAQIPQMDQESVRRFERELWGDAMDKDGLVLDIRGNGGGNTHDELLQALSHHVYSFDQPRDGLRANVPVHAWTKPIVLLVDQNSFSDAEIFPAGFRALHLGKIVGVTTPGYVIGTYESQLVDGTRFRIPTIAYYTTEGKNLENLGIVPDVPVENTPEDIATGHDRQLEVAVETLLKDLPTSTDTRADAGGGGAGVGLSSANDNPNGGSSAIHAGKK